jgi:hypothetical protein
MKKSYDRFKKDMNRPEKICEEVRVPDQLEDSLERQ